MAAASGTVTTAGWHYSYGNHIVIDHGNGFLTLYAHCQELWAAEGQAVSQGDTIALIGSTGNTSGTLLHFEIQTKEGELLSPMDYLTIPEYASASA